MKKLGDPIPKGLFQLLLSSLIDRTEQQAKKPTIVFGQPIFHPPESFVGAHESTIIAHFFGNETDDHG